MWEGNVTPCWGRDYVKITSGIFSSSKKFWQLHHHHPQPPPPLLTILPPPEELVPKGATLTDEWVIISLGWGGAESRLRTTILVSVHSCFMWPSVWWAGLPALPGGEWTKYTEDGPTFSSRHPPLHMQGCSCSLPEEGSKCSLCSHYSEYYYIGQRRHDLCSENCWELCNFYMLALI